MYCAVCCGVTTALCVTAVIYCTGQDTSACFTFGLALLDHVAHYVTEEEGCTLEAANVSLSRAMQCNNYAAWVLALHSSFGQCVELVDELVQSVSTVAGEYCHGGILDALLFFEGEEREGCVCHVCVCHVCHVCVM